MRKSFSLIVVLLLIGLLWMAYKTSNFNPNVPMMREDLGTLRAGAGQPNERGAPRYQEGRVILRAYDVDYQGEVRAHRIAESDGAVTDHWEALRCYLSTVHFINKTQFFNDQHYSFSSPPPGVLPQCHAFHSGRWRHPLVVAELMARRPALVGPRCDVESLLQAEVHWAAPWGTLEDQGLNCTLNYTWSDMMSIILRSGGTRSGRRWSRLDAPGVARAAMRPFALWRFQGDSLHRNMMQHMVSLLRGQHGMLDRHCRGYIAYVATTHRDYLLHVDLRETLRSDPREDCKVELAKLYQSIGLMTPSGDVLGAVDLSGVNEEVLFVLEWAFTNIRSSSPCLHVEPVLVSPLGAADVIFTSAFYSHPERCDVLSGRKNHQKYQGLLRRCLLLSMVRDEQYADLHLDKSHQPMLVATVPQRHSHTREVYNMRNFLHLNSRAFRENARNSTAGGGVLLWRLDRLDADHALHRLDHTHYACVISERVTRGLPGCNDVWNGVAARVMLAIVDHVCSNRSLG